MPTLTNTPDVDVNENEPPFDKCPQCGRRYQTLMTPNESRWRSSWPQFQPDEPVDLCINWPWIIVHTGDVEVTVLGGWQMWNDLHDGAEYSFTHHPEEHEE